MILYKDLNYENYNFLRNYYNDCIIGMYVYGRNEENKLMYDYVDINDVYVGKDTYSTYRKKYWL